MSEEERQWVLDNVEEVRVDTNDIDEICCGLEHLTIFATENINILVNNIFKIESENKELKDILHKINVAGIENNETPALDLIKENKILKQNALNNDKVVDKVNWENRLLKGRNKMAIEYINQRIEDINNGGNEHDYRNLKKLLEILDGDK